MARGSRPVYVISIAASLAGCHPRTLRIYEEEGLVEPVRTDSNIRLYSDLDLQRVRIIRYLTQQRGVNLAGVKMLLHFRDAADLLRERRDSSDRLKALRKNFAEDFHSPKSYGSLLEMPCSTSWRRRAQRRGMRPDRSVQWTERR